MTAEKGSSSAAARTLGMAQPTLGRRALPSLDPFIFPIWLKTHRELNTSRRVRMVFNFLADELA